jgi:spore germination protein GerM
MVCFLVLLSLSSCTTLPSTNSNQPTPLATVAVPSSFEVSNHDYRSTDAIGEGPMGVISYQLLTAPNSLRYWYVPVSEIIAPTPDVPLVAANKTLASICKALGIPGVEVTAVRVEDGTGYLDLPQEFSDQVPAMTSLKAVGDALVATLTEFTDVKQVQFLVEGKVKNFLTTGSAQYDTSLPLARPQWLNEDPTRNEPKVLLYWRWKDEPWIVPITFRLEGSGDLPRQALYALLKGPDAQDRLNGDLAQYFLPSVPRLGSSADPQSLVRSFVVRDGVAYVDFEKNVLPMILPGGEDMGMALDAMTLTLTEFPEIKKVQFMVGGKVMAVKIGSVNLGAPLNRPRWINHST